MAAAFRARTRTRHRGPFRTAEILALRPPRSRDAAQGTPPPARRSPPARSSRWNRRAARRARRRVPPRRGSAPEAQPAASGDRRSSASGHPAAGAARPCWNRGRLRGRGRIVGLGDLGIGI